MKHSKLICCLLMLITAATLLCGCNRYYDMGNSEYVVIEVGAFDGADGGAHSSELLEWSTEKLNPHQDSRAENSMTVHFNGATYQGDYSTSIVRQPTFYTSHKYVGDQVIFEVDEQKELTSVIFIYEPLAIQTTTEEYCKQIADSIADDYIDLDEYQSTVSSVPIYSNCIYSFTYYREVSGYQTTDQLTVAVDGNGNISSFGRWTLDAFKNVREVTYDGVRAEASIRAKIDSIYENNSAKREHEIKNVVLLRLPDGRCAFLYTVKNSFERIDGKYTDTSSSQIKLLLTTA